MGTAVTGWRTQPPATQRGNDSRTLHLIFRTSPTRLSRWFAPGCSVPSCALSTQHQPKHSTMTSPPKCLKGENAIRSFYLFILNRECLSSFWERGKSVSAPRRKNSNMRGVEVGELKVVRAVSVNLKSLTDRSAV